MTNYCEKHNTKRPDAVREAIQRLNDRDQSYFLTAEWREKLGKFENELNHGAEQVTQAVQLMMDLLHEMNQAIKQRSDEHEKK
ncbi:hypothetical protein J1TS5_10260 [Paenibacillus macerans]|nr:hypothetical protein J1TS5_10260 [Paenibacillus macerans]